MRNLRRLSQVAFLLLFLWLFAASIGRVDWGAESGLNLKSALPVDLFLRLDPLANLTAMLSAHSFSWGLFAWSIPVLALTLLAGRAFCGWICPLGTCIDACDKVFRPKKLRHTGREVSYPLLKYYLLAGMFVTTLFGAQLVWFLDPIPLLVRSLTVGVFGPVQWMLESTVNWPVVGAASRAALDSWVFPEKTTVFRSATITLILFALVLAGGVLSRRFWCRSICPLGALLGLIARIPLLHRTVKPACTECTLCQRDCKMSAVGEKGFASQPAECVYCYSCVDACPTDAAEVSFFGQRRNLELNLDRRRVLGAMGLGLLWGVSVRSSFASQPTRDGAHRLSGRYLVRPPGSVAEDDFTQKCVRCGQCLKVCPTNGLQPALFEGGLEGIWTPVLVPRRGECVHKCNLCSQVCPTEAILPFDWEEKEHLYIGRAVIDRSTCVVWESDKECLVCDEVCSYHAIYWTEEAGGKRPHVDMAKCVGCGICENNCPAGGPYAAIRVTAEGDKRSLTRDQQKAWRKAHRDPSRK